MEENIVAVVVYLFVGFVYCVSIAIVFWRSKLFVRSDQIIDG